MARKSKSRKGKGKKVYAIIVDGETEVWYFMLMKRHEALPKIDIRPELPKKKKLKEQYEKVVEYLDYNVYDRVIWLLDFDTLIKEDIEKKKGQKSSLQAFKEYKQQLERYNTKEKRKVEVLVNTPCLEFWYLLHFEQTGRYYPQCITASKDLKKHLPNYEKTRNYYLKQDNDLYKRLKPYQETAILNAKKLGDLDFDNPQTATAEIYKIFNILAFSKT